MVFLVVNELGEDRSQKRTSCERVVNEYEQIRYLCQSVVKIIDIYNTEVKVIKVIQSNKIRIYTWYYT